MPFDMVLVPQQRCVAAVTQLAPNRRWRGMLKIIEGTAAPQTFHFAIELVFASGALKGRGVTEDDDPVEIVGYFEVATVAFELAVQRSERLPFQCNGRIDDMLSRMSGGAFLGCVFPKTCGCFGQRGEFDFSQES